MPGAQILPLQFMQEVNEVTRGCKNREEAQCVDVRKGINHVGDQSRQLVRNPKITPSGYGMFFLILPTRGDRFIHRNFSFLPSYFTRNLLSFTH